MPYQSYRTILVQVASRTDIAHGVFYVTVFDSTASIRMRVTEKTMFDELVPGCSYYITGARLVLSREGRTQIRTLSMGRAARIEACAAGVNPIIASNASTSVITKKEEVAVKADNCSACGKPLDFAQLKTVCCEKQMHLACVKDTTDCQLCRKQLTNEHTTVDGCCICLEALDAAAQLKTACCERYIHFACVKNITICPLCRGALKASSKQLTGKEFDVVLAIIDESRRWVNIRVFCIYTIISLYSNILNYVFIV